MLMRNIMFYLSRRRAITDLIARTGMRTGFARRFVAGERLEEAIAAARTLNGRNLKVSLNYLGENISDAREARAAGENYKDMLEALDRERIVGNISVKLTQLGLDFDRKLCEQLLESIVLKARSLGRSVEIDMEGSKYTQATLDIFASVRKHDENTRVAIQAYLYRTEADLRRLISMRARVRLVKGAYLEPKEIAFQSKEKVDRNYLKLMEMLLDSDCYPAIATHDERMIDHARGYASAKGKGPKDFEFQMIFGVRRDLQERLAAEGYTMRVYIPYGEQWCPYFMRRLAERPANVWFVIKNLLKG